MQERTNMFYFIADFVCLMSVFRHILSPVGNTLQPSDNGLRFTDP